MFEYFKQEVEEQNMIKNKDVNFESKISGDKLIRTTKVDEYPIEAIVLTQQEFQECYKRWIMPFVSTLNAPNSNVGSNWEMK